VAGICWSQWPPVSPPVGVKSQSEAWFSPQGADDVPCVCRRRAAIIHIQRIMRGKLARNFVKRLKERRRNGATRMQVKPQRELVTSTFSLHRLL
jgi:hypothetical protein